MGGGGGVRLLLSHNMEVWTQPKHPTTDPDLLKDWRRNCGRRLKKEEKRRRREERRTRKRGEDEEQERRGGEEKRGGGGEGREEMKRRGGGEVNVWKQTSHLIFILDVLL